MADVVSFGSEKPPWRPSRRLLAAGVTALLAAGVAAGFVSRNSHEPTAATPLPSSGEQAPPTGSPSGGPTCAPGTTAPARPVAMVIGCAAKAGGGLVRRDDNAAKGPFAVVVRKEGGSLGRDRAVVVFPVPAAPPSAQPGTRIWPLAGKHARVHGDLTEPELAAIADGTRIVAGRPQVKAPNGFTATPATTYDPVDLNEVRYGTVGLGEQDSLDGGLTFTGVTSGGRFDDDLLDTPPTPVGEVAGKPAVITSVFGGNGALAWDPVPGVIAYIGYSGATLSDNATNALLRLAARARFLDAGQWRATNPSVVTQ